MDKKIQAAVIGGSGLTGLELIKILNSHRFVEISLVTSNTYRDRGVADAFPSFCDFEKKDSENQMVFKATDEAGAGELKSADVVFLCLPPFESMSFIKKNLQGFDGVIIDIGSDFRIKDPEDFKAWYGKEHELKEAISDYVYGLPEIYRDSIINSRRIANPGCYPTSVLLALAPALGERDFEIDDVVIDSKSGVSGAGRKLKDDYLYCGINENFSAYSVLMHRHTGEIEQELKNLSGSNLKICFTPHLLPVSRGIFTSVYCRIKKNGENKISNRQIIDTYLDFYKDCQFIRVLGEKTPQLKDVTGTNCCQIGIAYDGRTAVLKVFSTIDNLLKGAAGQAVQNMNLVFNFDEGEALDGQGIFS